MAVVQMLSPLRLLRSLCMNHLDLEVFPEVRSEGGKDGEEGECFGETSQFIGGTAAETMVAKGSKGRQTRNK